MRPAALLPLLLTLTLSAGATLVPGSAKEVTAPVPDVAPFDQSGARIATDGDAFLAVWIDHTINGSGNVHGSRVSPEGKRVDDDVLRIAVMDANEDRVALAYGGGRYLVVWATPAMMRGRFVGADATMSDAFDIAPLTQFAQPRVAFNGHRFLVEWFAVTLFRGALIGTDGTVVKTFDIGSTALTSYENATALAAMNGVFQFVTTLVDINGVLGGNGYPSDVGVRPIDENGTVGERVVIAPAATPAFDVHAAVSGNELLVAWTSAVAIAGGTVRNVRVTSAGAGPVDIIPADGMYLHDVVADSGGFLLFYGGDGTKYVRRPNASQPIGTVATPPTETSILSSASNGARTLVLVQGAPRGGFDWGPAGGDLYVTRLDTMAIEPLVIAPRHQQAPDVAAAGDLRLAIWCEYIGSERRLGVVGARLRAGGSSLDANGIDVHANVFHPVTPRVASNGTDWLVVWRENFNVYGARISHGGAALDAAPFVIAANVYGSSDVAVSWNGAQYVVVYTSGEVVRGPRLAVQAALVTPDGLVAFDVLALSVHSANEFPAIASSPQASLVVWRDGLYLQAVSLNHNGLATNVGIPSIYPAGPRPSVAWNGDTFLVAAPFSGSFGNQIQWQLISATGVVRTPPTAFLDLDSSIGAGTGFPSLEVEAYGDGFLLFWTDVAADAEARRANVYVARINGQGILADGPKLIATTLGAYTPSAYTPSIGAAGNMVVFANKIGHPTRELARVYASEVQSVAGKPRRRAVR
jgi:hypothetical protein